MNRYSYVVVQRTNHPHHPVQCEPPKICVSDTREVGGCEAGHPRRLSHAETALVQNGDDPGREDGLGLLQIGLGISEIAKDIAASLDQLEVFVLHRISSFLSRHVVKTDYTRQNVSQLVLECSQLAQRSHSKEGRKSLCIIGVALLVTVDIRLSLVDLTPGRRPDALLLQRLATDLARRCCDIATGTETLTRVFNNGNNSRENLKWVERSPFHFIGFMVPI